jgi:hypothetical protein
MVVVFQPGTASGAASRNAIAAQTKTKTMTVVVARCRPPTPKFTG